MEPLDLALGLRVSRGSVLLADTEQRQQVFERVATTTEAGGLDASVVGQSAGRGAVLIDRLEEGRDDRLAGHGLMNGAG